MIVRTEPHRLLISSMHMIYLSPLCGRSHNREWWLHTVLCKCASALRWHDQAHSCMCGRFSFRGRRFRLGLHPYRLRVRTCRLRCRCLPSLCHCLGCRGCQFTFLHIISENTTQMTLKPALVEFMRHAVGRAHTHACDGLNVFRNISYLANL